MPDAPTPDDLAAIRARHRPKGQDHSRYCDWCGYAWPCDAARLLDLLDRETAHWRAAEADLARCGAELRGFSDEADRAERVVEAAREWRASLGRAHRRTGLTRRYLNAVEALDTALADYDAATQEKS